MSTVTTFATPCAITFANSNPFYMFRCRWCYRVVFQASDGTWHHGHSGARKCREVAR